MDCPLGQKKGPLYSGGRCGEVALGGGSTLYHYCLLTVKYWRTNYCLIGIFKYWLNNWSAYWRRLGFYFTEWMTWLDSTVWLDCMFLLVDFFICCELYGEVLKSLLLSCNSISRRENGYKLSAQRFLGSFWWTSVSFYFTMVSKPTNNYHELGYKPLRLVFFV